MIPEAALQLIEEEHLTVGRVYPWTDFKEFNRRLLRRQVENESRIPFSIDVVILDRSLLGLAAYWRNHELLPMEELFERISLVGYTHVFFLDTLPECYWNQTRNGYPRKQTYQEALSFSKLLLEVHKGFNVSLKQIPVIEPVEERADYIGSVENLLSRKA